MQNDDRAQERKGEALTAQLAAADQEAAFYVDSTAIFCSLFLLWLLNLSSAAAATDARPTLSKQTSSADTKMLDIGSES